MKLAIAGLLLAFAFVLDGQFFHGRYFHALHGTSTQLAAAFGLRR